MCFDFGGIGLGMGRLGVLGTLQEKALPRRAFDIPDLCFPSRGVDIREGEADDDDAAAEAIGEVDAFAHLAAYDAEKECAFTVAAAVDGACVGGECHFCVLGLAVCEEGFFGFEALVDRFAGSVGCGRGERPPLQYGVQVGVGREEGHDAVWDDGAEIQQPETQVVNHGSVVAVREREVEVLPAWAAAQRPCNKVLFRDDVSAGKGCDGGRGEVGE